MINIYDQNTAEYLKDGYYDNNSILPYVEETANFEFEIVATVATAYLEEVNEEKLKIQELESTKIDSYACTVTSDKIYLESQAFTEFGIYRYIIDIDGVNYWSDLFCIKEEETVTEVLKMESGELSVYSSSYSEYLKDGYFDNNSILNYQGKLSNVFFTPIQAAATVYLELYIINKISLEGKVISETKINDLTLLDNNGKYYYIGGDYNTAGLYRYKFIFDDGITTPYDYWSEIFCINVVQVWILAAGLWNDAGIWIDTELWID